MSDAIRRLRAALYFASFVLIISGVVDVIANAIPLVPSNVEWRYGFSVFASGYLTGPLFGALLAALTAAAGGNRTALRIMAAITGISAAALLVAMLGLGLDMLQLKGQVAPNYLQQFEIGGLKAFFKYLITGFCLALVAWGLFRSARAMGRADGGGRKASTRLHDEES